jgi:L-ascorbate metabolism protein UlaG (beta-lactamase superfamily)
LETIFVNHNKHHLPIAGAVAVLLLAWTTTTFSADEGDTIAAALDAAKPALPMTEARQEALKSLDTWIARPSSHKDKALIAYYQAAVDRALHALEHEKVASGVRIFQLYSSSVIVQTPETVFAFDLDQGPNVKLDRTPVEEGVDFRLTDDQRAKIAALVEYSFHTHEHSDHIDFQLTQALLEAGKTVVVTESNKTMWQAYPWAEKLTVLKQTLNSPTKLGPLMVHVLQDHQWGDTMHTTGVPCNAFVVTTPGGITVMTKGDINCGLQLYGWLSLLKQHGQGVDVVVGSTLFWKGVNTLREWDALFSPLWLPGHVWEFEHREDNEPKGNCSAYAEGWRFVRNATHSEKVQVLSWGEWIDVAAK